MKTYQVVNGRNMGIFDVVLVEAAGVEGHAASSILFYVIAL